MCGRYYIDPEDELEAMLATPIAAGGLFAKRAGEIRPADTALVLANSRTNKRRLFPMKWGFPRTDGKLLMINARCETAAEKPAFSPSTQNRRCIIPASGYFEWGRAGAGKKQKYLFTSAKKEPSLIFMAGLYTFDEATRTPYYTILTRDASPELAHIHGRMPVLLAPDAVDAWLSPEGEYSALVLHAITDVAPRPVQ